MTRSSKARQQVSDKFARKADVVESVRVQLGDLNGNLYPDYTNSPNVVYYRLGEIIGSIINMVAPPMLDLWVRIGISPLDGIYQVLGVDGNQLGGTVSRVAGYAPSSYYSWGGQDPLIVSLRQIRGFRPTVNNGMVLTIGEGWLETPSGWRYIAEQTYDCSGDRPNMPDTAAFLLFTFNTSGTLVRTMGADVTPLTDLVATPAPNALLSNLPAKPASTQKVICAVRVYRTVANVLQTTLYETTTNTDLIDMRWFSEEGGASASEVPYAHGNMGAAETLDAALGGWQTGTLDADCTITVMGFTVDDGTVLLFKVTQDGTGGWTISWDPAVQFPSGGDDQPDASADAITWFLLWSDEGDSSIYASKIGAGDTAGQILGKLLTVDGAGSLLDADLLDGLEGTALPLSGDATGTLSAVVNTQARGLRETAGPTTLALGAVADGDYLLRSGNNIVGGVIAAGGAGGQAVLMFRWEADGGATYDYPDMVESVLMATDNGSVVDPAIYSLSADRTQIVFDSGITAAHVITSIYSSAQV